MPVNYQTELKRLEDFDPLEVSPFWKPEAGKWRVKALSELENAEPYHEEGKDPVPQAKIDLELIENNVTRKVTWTMGIGKTKASAYGQLCAKAIELAGTLKGKDFMIVVTNDGKKNTYTIV